MAKRIKCPACGARGEFGDDVNFETRGQLQGRGVQKCLGCGSGVFVRLVGRPETIPQDMWMRMQELWAQEFPEDVDDGDNMPVIEEAVGSLFEEAPDDLAPSIFVLASAAHDITGAAVQLMARDNSKWAQLELGTAKAVIRCAGTYFVMASVKDGDFRRSFADWLDVKPSQVETVVMNEYNKAFLSAREAELANAAVQKWNEEDPSGYSIALARLIWHAAGRQEDTPPIDEVLRWRAALHSLREAFGSHFTSELDRVSQE